MSHTPKISLATACLAVAAFQPAMAEHGSASAEQRQIDRGRYVIRITGCNDCHTTGYAQSGGKVEESQWLMGDRLAWHGPWGTTYAINLRLLIASLTVEQWVVLARDTHPRPPMPWWSLRDMSQEDLKALYAFVKWLGPAGAPAPNSLPPGQQPAGPAVQFPE